MAFVVGAAVGLAVPKVEQGERTMSTLHERLSRIALQELTGQAYVTVEDAAMAMAAAILNNAEGYAVVELPEVDDTDPDGCLWFSDMSDAGTVGAYPGHHVVWGVWEWTPEQARTVASQWLAAADAAEAS